jgi:acyl-CoA thioester hydrolase
MADFPVTTFATYRVVYADTDQMGNVYYGNYGKLYEIGRAEMVREIGITYAELEETGIGMPVYSVESRYRGALRYDERVTIETTLEKLPAARIEFKHRIFGESGELAHEATVVLVFQDMKTRKLIRAPRNLVSALEAYRP